MLKLFLSFFTTLVTFRVPNLQHLDTPDASQFQFKLLGCGKPDFGGRLPGSIIYCIFCFPIDSRGGPFGFQYGTAGIYFVPWDLAFCLPGCLDNYFLTRRGWFSLCHVTVWLSLFWLRLRGICDQQLARTDSRIPRLVISEIATLRLFAWVQLTRPDGFIFFPEGLSLYGELVPEDECWTAVLWKNMLPPVQILASEFEY